MTEEPTIESVRDKIAGIANRVDAKDTSSSAPKTPDSQAPVSDTTTEKVKSNDQHVTGDGQRTARLEEADQVDPTEQRLETRLAEALGISSLEVLEASDPKLTEPYRDWAQSLTIDQLRALTEAELTKKRDDITYAFGNMTRDDLTQIIQDMTSDQFIGFQKFMNSPILDIAISTYLDQHPDPEVRKLFESGDKQVFAAAMASYVDTMRQLRNALSEILKAKPISETFLSDFQKYQELCRIHGLIPPDDIDRKLVLSSNQEQKAYKALAVTYYEMIDPELMDDEGAPFIFQRAVSSHPIGADVNNLEGRNNWRYVLASLSEIHTK